MYITRKLEIEVLQGINDNPVTAVIGPRQCGKSTLAKQIIQKLEKKVIFLDLERPTDLQKLDNAEWFLGTQKGKLVCIDEIQRKAELFPLIRSLVDEWGGNGHFLILGSASRELIMQSSESLAGRIGYKTLSPFLYSEVKDRFTLDDYLVRGGFPRSLLRENEPASVQWREDFITTFLERDLLFWSGFSTLTMRKLWQMLAFLNGQVINYSTLANSLGVSPPTARNYVELLSSTFMVRLLPPFLPNTGKRLVKSPRIYLTDTGIANTLLGISNFEQLAGNPSVGAAWEAMALQNLTGHFPKHNFYFYRTSHGAETDIVMERHKKLIAIECKSGMQPSLGRGNYSAISDLKPEATLIISPVKSGWSVRPGVHVTNLDEAIVQIAEISGAG